MDSQQQASRTSLCARDMVYKHLLIGHLLGLPPQTARQPIANYNNFCASPKPVPREMQITSPPKPLNY